jgi:hypothetical protein
MKAITILQPWASLIPKGLKHIETRSWSTRYRGLIAIHAGKQWTTDLRALTRREPFFSAIWNEEQRNMLSHEREKTLPLGCVIATAYLTHCLEINESQVYYLEQDLKEGRNKEILFGDYTLGRFAWILNDIRPVKPVPAKGQQRLWEWEGKFKE